MQEAPDGWRSQEERNSLNSHRITPPETHKAPEFGARTYNSLEEAPESTEFSSRRTTQEAATWFPWAFLNHQQVEPPFGEPRARQFNSRGKRITGEFRVHPTCPHEFTVQESLWKACPRTFSSSLPRPPSGEEGRGRQRPQFSASSPSTTQRPPKEKEREGYCCLLWTMERER